MEEPTQNQNPPAPNPQPQQGKGKNKAMAIIAYIVFFIPLLTDAKNDPFVKFHVKQGTVLFTAAVVAWLVVRVLPIIGWILSPIFNIAVLVFAILGIINAANGEEKPLPLIGQLSEYLKF